MPRLLEVADDQAALMEAAATIASSLEMFLPRRVVCFRA